MPEESEGIAYSFVAARDEETAENEEAAHGQQPRDEAVVYATDRIVAESANTVRVRP
jgi:hypothetical protein